MTKKKKIIIAIIVIAIVVLISVTSVLLIVNRHNWSNATCTKLSYCYDCGKKRGDYAPHSYSYGHCTVCGHLEYETEQDIISTVKSIYGIYWIGSYNKYVKIAHADYMTVTFDDISFNNNKCTVKGSIISKTEDDNFYSDNFTMYLKYYDGSWVKDSTKDCEYNLQPVKAYKYAGPIDYNFSYETSYTHKTYVGKEKAVLKFYSDSTGLLITYDYYGSLDEYISFTYVIHEGLQCDIILLNDEIEIFKFDDGLVWNSKAFLMD